MFLAINAHVVSQFIRIRYAFINYNTFFGKEPLIFSHPLLTFPLSRQVVICLFKKENDDKYLGKFAAIALWSLKIH